MAFRPDRESAQDFNMVVPTYDRRRLDDVCNGNEELRQRILDEYIRTSRPQIAQLVSQLRQANSPEAKRLAHGLMGSSRAIEAGALGDYCESLERWGSDDFPSGVGEQIQAEFERVLLAIAVDTGSNR